MDYITNINLLELIEDVKLAMKADAWFSALSLTFALIDKCSTIEYPEVANTNMGTNRFSKWVDTYINTRDDIGWKFRPNKNGKMVKKTSHIKIGNGKEYDRNEPYMDGELLYQLRCALLHGCSNNIDSVKINHNAANKKLISNNKYNFKYQISTQYIEMGWSNIQSSVDCFDNYYMTIPIDGLIWPILLAVKDFYELNKEKFNSITIIDYKNVYKMEEDNQ